MRWLTFAVLFLCALSVTAQDVNKNPNKKEPPILGPHWANGSAHSHNAGGSPERCDSSGTGSVLRISWMTCRNDSPLKGLVPASSS